MGKNKDLNENEIKEEELEVTQEAEDTQPTEEEKLISEIAVLKDKSLRLQADFDNFRKRNASVVSKTREETTKDVLTDLLAVADNLERAMTMITDENTKAGIQLVMNQLNTIFEKYNVTEMQSLGAEFDPNYHNAIMQEDDPENAGKITMVFQKGYMIKDTVLRYATVRVAK